MPVAPTPPPPSAPPFYPAPESLSLMEEIRKIGGVTGLRKRSSSQTQEAQERKEDPLKMRLLHQRKACSGEDDQGGSDALTSLMSNVQYDEQARDEKEDNSDEWHLEERYEKEVPEEVDTKEPKSQESRVKEKTVTWNSSKEPDIKCSFCFSSEAPGSPAVVDDQGPHPYCTLHAMSKAVTQFFHCLGIDVDQDDVTSQLIKTHAKGIGIDPNCLDNTYVNARDKFNSSKEYSTMLLVRKVPIDEFKTATSASLTKYVVDYATGCLPPHTYHCIYAQKWLPEGVLRGMNSWGPKEPEPLIPESVIRAIYSVDCYLPNHPKAHQLVGQAGISTADLPEDGTSLFTDLSSDEVQRSNEAPANSVCDKLKSDPSMNEFNKAETPHCCDMACSDSYPDVLTISSDGLAGTKQKAKMGTYKKVEALGLSNNRPVWKQQDGDEFFFFDKDSSKWMVGPDYKKSLGGIQSQESNLTTIPEEGWMFTYHQSKDNKNMTGTSAKVGWRSTKEWEHDMDLKVEGEVEGPDQMRSDSKCTESSVSIALSKEFSSLSIKKSDVEEAESFFHGKSTDLWKESTDKNISRKISSDHYASHVTSVMSTMPFPSDKLKVVQGIFERANFARLQAHQVDAVSVSVNDFTSAIVGICTKKHEDGSITAAYAYHTLEFRVKDIQSIKDTYCKHRALQALANMGVIPSIEYI